MRYSWTLCCLERCCTEMLFVLQRGQTQLIELCTLPLWYGESDQSQSECRWLRVSQGANMNSKWKQENCQKKMEKCKWRRCLLILLISFCIKSGWLSKQLGIFEQSLSVVKQNQNKPRLPLYSFNIALTNNDRNNETANHEVINAIEQSRITLS